MDRFRDRFTLAGANDDSRDAEVMASALRTDPHCFRLLAALDPTVIELREWSRIASILARSVTASSTACMISSGATFTPCWSRKRSWRPMAARLVGTGAHTRQGRAHPRGDVAKLLKRHRIRRFDAAHVLDVLRQPAVQVAGERLKRPAPIARRSLRASAL